VRDYVHVTDLAQAHLLGLDYMQNNKGFFAFNLGNGDGFSVLEVIKGCEKIADTKISFQIDGRREGDPASLVADSRKAKKLLGWNGQFGYLDNIVSTALEWHKTHKDEL